MAEKPDPNPSTSKLEPEDEERRPELKEEEASRPRTREDAIAASRIGMEFSLIRRLQTPPVPVPVRVHDVIVKGNGKTKDHVIQAEVDVVRKATTMQELREASQVANFNLQRLDIFDSVNITFDFGPPGTTNVVIDVVESKSGRNITINKPEATSLSFGVSTKYKNLFGYGDIWNGSFAYGSDKAKEFGLGMSLPRFRGRPTPFTSRLYLNTHDWLKFSSYKERKLGISLGLVLTKYHNVAYNIAWRNLTDPSPMASRSIRRQRGHHLVSDLKYTFKYFLLTWAEAENLSIGFTTLKLLLLIGSFPTTNNNGVIDDCSMTLKRIFFLYKA